VFLQQKHLAGGFASGFYHAMEEAELLRCCMATDVEEYLGFEDLIVIRLLFRFCTASFTSNP